ncbi:MAG: restriction endonuclease subunit S [Motiliproteus sp.]|nr:restriction endonuclease subunit S [Motiliproteus sp.]MCW9053233.1 restriction endonuclease subunit S [Motiliproteus sp.]
MIVRVPLSKVAQINPRLPRDTDESQSVSFLAMASVSEEGRILEQETRILGETKKGYTYFERGDVLLAKITPCFENGKAALVDDLEHQIGFGSTEFHVLRADPEQLDSKYLFYMVWSDHFRFFGQKSMQGAAGQKRVSADFLKKFEIPLPPLAEQQRIAAILDKADALRRKRQQAIDLADQFLRSLFLDMFGDPVSNPKGWDERILSDIALVRSGVTKGRKLAGKKTVMVPYMRVANVQDSHIKLDDVQEIEVLEADAERYALELGDLLLTEGGDPDKLGRGAVWHGEVSPCIHQNHIFCVRSDAEIVHPEFLSAQISSQRGKRYFLKVGKQTTGIATINKTVLSAYPAIVPPMEQQLRYIEVVKKVRSSKSKASNSEAEMNQLFQSISAQAFAGQL